MRDLILLRHAHADAADAGQPDLDRPLSATGREDARAAGDVTGLLDVGIADALDEAARVFRVEGGVGLRELLREADHLAEDTIILFPITGETYGTGSLAETGFSALQAIKLNRHRDFVVMIERELDPALNDPVARKESLRSRALVRKHLEKLSLASLYVVDSLDDMLALSLELHAIALMRQRAERFRIRK